MYVLIIQLWNFYVKLCYNTDTNSYVFPMKLSFKKQTLFLNKLRKT